MIRLFTWLSARAQMTVTLQSLKLLKIIEIVEIIENRQNHWNHCNQTSKRFRPHHNDYQCRYLQCCNVRIQCSTERDINANTNTNTDTTINTNTNTTPESGDEDNDHSVDNCEGRKDGNAHKPEPEEDVDLRQNRIETKAFLVLNQSHDNNLWDDWNFALLKKRRKNWFSEET